VLVVEGPRAVEAALDAGADVHELYTQADATAMAASVIERARGMGIRIFTVEEKVLTRVADAVTPQAVLAVAAFTPMALDRLEPDRDVLVLVNVRDPGNAGTLLRSGEAAGVGAVVFCRGSVDVTNPKTVRASAGTVFAVPVVTGVEPEEVLVVTAQLGLQRFGATAHGGRRYTDVDLTRPTCYCFGNEAAGFPPEMADRLDGTVTIPLAGRAESLNVGMAATVLLFEAVRQRAALAPEHAVPKGAVPNQP